MIIEKAMSPEWLSNSYLLADRPGGHAVIIDTGGPPQPILEKIDALRLVVTHVLCTHHHVDHVANNSVYRNRLSCRVCGHRDEAGLFGGLDVELTDGQVIETGELRLLAVHIPGHTVGQLAYVAGAERVFTGDTLFRGSVGGTRAPGHTTFQDLKHSIMQVLMKLPESMAVHPGHAGVTSIGREWSENPFIRIWRGLDPPSGTRCMALGEPATLMLRAADYDGGTKCWVRFDRHGRDDVVPGSRVVSA